MDTQKLGKKEGSFLRHFKGLFSRQRLGELLVLSGLITPQDLRDALHAQKEKNMPLGEVLLQEGRISKWDLRKTLFKQQALRVTAGLLIFMASVGGAANKSQADLISDVPARISLTSAANTAFAPMKAHPSVMHTVERQSKDISAFTKWSDMFDRFDTELRLGTGNQALQAWRAQLSNIRTHSIKNMAVSVNTLVNQVSYIVDQKNWGKSDYWATPVEFLTRGGDCEDFAIAKYTAMRALGVPEDRLRIAIVQDTVKNIPHAVLIVYTEEGPYILDNQIKTLVDASSNGRYQPIYSINRSAWWLHTAPEPTVVASSSY